MSQQANPRARVGRDTRRQAMWDRTARFNPRALVGATWAVVDILAEVDVSIRAPRGTRLVALLIGVLLKLVSIHVPAWGATGAPDQPEAVTLGFNPRARVGRDCLLAGQIPTIRQSNLTSKSQQGYRRLRDLRFLNSVVKERARTSRQIDITYRSRDIELDN